MYAQTPPASDTDWEACWAPYDEVTYQSVLDEIQPKDVVLDIGAGDLRLAERMAAICQQVYAIENQPALLEAARQRNAGEHSKRLTILQGDAREVSFPNGLTTGVLLMRHCTHFNLYAHKLKQAGARKLITNARWRMGVESIDLRTRRTPYQLAGVGWYACWCGAAGFKSGPVEDLTPETLERTTEVENCPNCHPN